MIMLREFDALQQRKKLLQMTNLIPDLLFVHYSIKNISPNDIRVFAYPFESPLYWFLLDIQNIGVPRIHIAKDGGNHDTHIFKNALQQFLKQISPDIVGLAQIEIAAESILMHEATSFLAAYLPNFEMTDCVSHTLFYMTPEQQQKVMKIEIGLPYGYSFSKLSSSDVENIKENSREDEQELTGERIVSYPSSCIVHDSSSQLVSHELSSIRGDMVQLYTVPEHRRQGLGHAVELQLAQNLINYHSTPFKAVPNYLTSMLISSEDSPLWTMWSRNRLPVHLLVHKLNRQQ